MITNISHLPVEEPCAQALPLSTPSGLVECGYYLTLLYVTLSGAFGLAMEKVGILMLALLCLLCILAVGARVPILFQLAAFPIGCGITHIFVQLLIHDEPLGSEYIRIFVPWMLGLIIIQSLALRKDFLDRFALFILSVGLAMLPFLSSYDAGGYERVGLDSGVGYANPNALGAWFGFCAVYFTIKGHVARQNNRRFLFWLIAVGCIYVTALTVSRGALLAVTVAILFASRHLLQRGLFPIFLLAGLGFAIFESGIFDGAIRSYGHRVDEGSSRLQAWPLLLEIFLNSPLFGVGASHAYIVVPGTGKVINAHNAFVFIAVGSGIIPLALFVGYWIRSVSAALRANITASLESAFYVPLLIYTFFIISVGNLDYMAPWAIVSLAVPVAATVGESSRGACESAIGEALPAGCVQ